MRRVNTCQCMYTEPKKFYLFFFFFSSRRRHTRFDCDWSSDVCSSDLRDRFDERHSPVVHRIGPERMEGRNWTDAVLHAYGRMGSVAERASGSASVDIEPQTLSWLLKRDSSADRKRVV